MNSFGLTSADSEGATLHTTHAQFHAYKMAAYQPKNNIFFLILVLSIHMNLCYREEVKKKKSLLWFFCNLNILVYAWLDCSEFHSNRSKEWFKISHAVYQAYFTISVSTLVQRANSERTCKCSNNKWNSFCLLLR